MSSLALVSGSMLVFSNTVTFVQFLAMNAPLVAFKR